MEFRKIIDDFRRDGGIDLGETPAQAHDRCFELAVAFTWFCRGRGLPARLLYLERVNDKFVPLPAELTDIERAFLNHRVTLVGGLTVDWTARQFWHDAAHPRIVPLAKIRKEWGVVDEMYTIDKAGNCERRPFVELEKVRQLKRELQGPEETVTPNDLRSLVNAVNRLLRAHRLKLKYRTEEGESKFKLFRLWLEEQHDSPNRRIS